MIRNATIFGAGGFVGSHLAKRLSQGDWRVTTVVRRPNDPACKLRLGGLQGRVTQLGGDAADPELVDRLVRRSDVVFALTGPPSSSAVPDSPINDLPAHLHPTLVLLEALRRADNPVRAIFAGSRLQYGVTCRRATPETAALRPMNWYGICKTFEEHMVANYVSVHGVDTTWLRVSMPYGPFQSASGRPFGIVGIFLDRAARGERILLYGGGHQLRDFVHVDDLTAALETAAIRDAASGEVFNIGGSGPVSLREMAQTVIEVVGQGRVVDAPWPSNQASTETGDYWADISKAGRLLGWAPEIGLREGITDTWRHERWSRPDALARDAERAS